MTPILVAAARVAPIFLIAPFFGGQAVPVWVRILLAGLFAALLAPTLPAAGVPPLLLVKEAAIGLFLGFLASLPLWAAEAAGSLADPRLGRFALLLGIAVFFLGGGHLAFVRALAASYDAIPVGILPARIPTDAALRATAQLVASAVGLAAPVLAAQVVIFVILAAAGRAAPAYGAVRALAVPFAFLLSVGALALAVRGELASSVGRLVLDISP
ncbi:MAG TPA: flagellar biosynthetic protein FliR [Haliangiales bacterium]|nr:flagellar biosynthetic protein FliR [Haliangiales bacterium]